MICGYTWEVDIDHETECSEYGEEHECCLSSEDNHAEHECPCGESQTEFDKLDNNETHITTPKRRTRKRKS